MIYTLHRYIGRDLLKISLIASSVFTLIMTTYSVIEPLRKKGLDGGQIFMLFWYLVPVMLSLTLPIAVLFAATYVYGRFSMDNELTASRAGGISLLSLMLPALVAGLLVGLTTLLLSNYIAPELAMRGEQTVRKNIKGIIYQQLRRESSVSFANNRLLLHADVSDRKNDQLHGLVLLDTSDRTGEDLSYYTATLAKVEFTELEDGAEVSVIALNPASGERNDNRIFESGHLVFGPEVIGTGGLRDKAAFYKWGDLLAILDDPRRNRRVQQALEGTYNKLRMAYFATDVAEAVKQGSTYDLYHVDGYRYVFAAPDAVIGRNARLTLMDSARAEEKDALPVTLNVYKSGSDNKLVRSVKCRFAQFRVVDVEKKPRVSVVLEDVSMTDYEKAASDLPGGNFATPAAGDSDESTITIRKKTHALGLLEMPASLDKKLSSVTLEELFMRPQLYPLVKDKTDWLEDYIFNRLRPRVLAEINGRLAYGIGCIMLIPVGAALGLRYRGGHILSAFALACAPAIVLLLTMMAGQQMVTNPDSNQAVGMVAIWAGVVGLAGLELWLFTVTLRK